MPVQLMYVSTATTECSEVVLKQILDTSIRRNGPNNISGLLLYSRGTFMQVLEGEKPDVMDIYQRILADKRHYDVLLLSCDPVENREFSAWHMAFRSVNDDDVKRLPAYAPFFEFGFDAAKIGAVPGCALQVLKSFR